MEQPTNSTVLQRLLSLFEQRSGLLGVDKETKGRPDGDLLLIKVANPTDRMFRLLEAVREEVVGAEEEGPRATIVRAAKSNPLQSAEGRLLLRTLSESLNINRHSFQDDFFARYTKSVSGAEEQIISAANHVVFGRRGAGKSSLLLYALHFRAQRNRDSAWVDMQVYAQRSDLGVAVDLLLEIVSQTRSKLGALSDAVTSILRNLQSLEPLTEAAIQKVLPDVRRTLNEFSKSGKDLAVFLDDYHVIARDLQPKLLALLYSVTRGNGIYLKLSAIESLTQTWDTSAKKGLQIPHDVQEIKLDYNLTIPEKATEHLTSILNAHAVYCGLASIRSLCTSSDVLSQWLGGCWCAAGRAEHIWASDD